LSTYNLLCAVGLLLYQHFQCHDGSVL
jgi:hypothetical protein